jgi:hypothetical protein
MELGSLLGTLGGGAAMANPVGMGIAAGAGILKTGLGFLQQAKGRKMLKRTVDPGYKIPKGFGQNLAQAEQMARTGMPSQQYNQAQQNISRNVGTGVRALSRSANPAAGVAGLVRAQNDATLGLDVSNAAAKRQNILQAMGARREMAGQQLAQQQYQQNRYFDKVNEAQARIGAGTQNIFGGISDIGTAGIMSGINKAEGSSGAGGGFSSGLFKGRGRLKELGSGLGKPNLNFNNQAYLQSLGLS